MSILVWLLLALLGLGATSTSTSTSPSVQEPPRPSAPSAAQEALPPGLGALRTDAAVAERFATRSPLPGCGLPETQDVAALSPAALEAYACLQRAADAGRGRELVIVVADPRGGTSYAWYRANPDGPLEVFVDLREVPDVGREWRYTRCEPSSDLVERPCAGSPGPS